MSAGRRLGALAIAVVIAIAGAVTIHGFFLNAYHWSNGTTVTMNMQLGATPSLLDGASSWNGVATNALSRWSPYLNLIHVAANQGSTVADGAPNGINNVTFNSTVYGSAFGSGVLAVTQTYYNTSTGLASESDVVFNTSYTWNSYRGNLRADNQQDLARVAVHEFGHVLGLSHPDQHGQSVTAIMNANVSNIEVPQADDIAGVVSLYGGGVTSNVSFPPRNEVNDFYAQLEVLYRDILFAAAVSSFVNAEGANVWLVEYARYRIGQCSHLDAASRVFSQIENTGTYGVCALTPAGPIPFPPRNEGLDFMNQLEAEYRDKLRASPSSAFVNNEGRVVWILEYLRYRLNGCNHGDATIRVFQQIRGQGIQPVCR